VENKLILVGRLIDEPVFESTKDGQMFARARIEVRTQGRPTTIIEIIFGGAAAEVLASDIDVGDLIRVSGWIHGREPKWESKKCDSALWIISESVVPFRKGASR
jgi:single-stranded DNA-binding protein